MMDFSFLNKRVILILLVVGWCCVIFSFSAEDSEESSRTSGAIIATVCEWIVPEFGDFQGEQRQEFIDDLQFAVRKSAHFTAYAILGFLSWFALYGIKKGYRYACAVGFSFLYACSDEIHQLFVPGRSGEFRDVLIDTAGAILGALIGLGFTALALKINRKKKST